MSSTYPAHFILLSVLQQHVFKTLENDPLFARTPGEDVPIEKMRELNFLRYQPRSLCYISYTYVFTAHRENKATDGNPQGEAAVPL